MSRIRAATLGAALLLGAALVPAAQAASPAELDHMSGMALLLGRGIACGLDTKRAAGVIEAWFDQTFPAAGEQDRYLPQFAEEVRRHVRQQRDGASPDSCAEVAQAFYAMRW
jgi:hypothetical protein